MTLRFAIALLPICCVFLLQQYPTCAFSPMFGMTRRSTMTMKRGRSSFQKEINSNNNNNNKGVQPMKDETGGNFSSKRWLPVQGLPSAKDLPKEQGKVVLVDTMVDSLKNGATNPTGAVSVVNFGGNTYCCSSSCPSCKIPLTKAKILDGEKTDDTKAVSAPRICCDFCSATYNLQTGEKVESAGSAGIFGGIVKGLLSSQDSGNLPVYELGEQKGKVVISL